MCLHTMCLRRSVPQKTAISLIHILLPFSLPPCGCVIVPFPACPFSHIRWQRRAQRSSRQFSIALPAHLICCGPNRVWRILEVEPCGVTRAL